MRRREAVSVTVRVVGARFIELFTGTVVCRKPLTLLVPAHAISVFDDGDINAVLVGDCTLPKPEIMPSHAPEGDHTAILRFKSHPRSLVPLRPIRLPSSAPRPEAGKPVTVKFADDDSPRTGRVVSVSGSGDEQTLVTDIRILPGASGSPVLVDGKLLGLCQGKLSTSGGDCALVIPLTDASLREIRVLQTARARKFRLRLALASALLAIGFVASAAFSWNVFRIGGLELSSDNTVLTVHNQESLSIRSTWRKAFATPILHTLAFSSVQGGAVDRIAVGTDRVDSRYGALTILDNKGRVLWQYTVPDNECIFAPVDEVYNGYCVAGVCVCDLNNDGKTEIIAAFDQTPFFPCKLVALSGDGRILAGYWHPGYIRFIAAGYLGRDPVPYIVATASNNALKTSFWNPQTLFAFRGLEISGQAPPYSGDDEHGSEVWYLIVPYFDEDHRPKGQALAVRDTNGDGENEVFFALTDGRFYYLNERGETVGTAVGDVYVRDFGGTPVPPLRPYPASAL